MCRELDFFVIFSSLLSCHAHRQEESHIPLPLESGVLWDDLNVPGLLTPSLTCPSNLHSISSEDFSEIPSKACTMLEATEALRHLGIYP